VIDVRVRSATEPVRSRRDGELMNFWLTTDDREMWTVDPSTPVTGFLGVREKDGFFGYCRAGRIVIERSRLRDTVDLRRVK
jgi:hypothetical protein